MLGLLQILVLGWGLCLGTGENPEQRSAAPGKCWLRADSLVAHFDGDLMTSLNPRSARGIHLSACWRHDFLSCSKGGLRDPKKRPQIPGVPLNRIGNEMERLVVNSRAFLASVESQVVEFMSGLAEAWEQQDCVHKAALALEFDRNFRAYWEYYAACDRWLPRAYFASESPFPPAPQGARSLAGPFDNQLSCLLVAPPRGMQRATSQFGAWLVSAAERSAGFVFELQEQVLKSELASWYRTTNNQIASLQSLANSMLKQVENKPQEARIQLQLGKELNKFGERIQTLIALLAEKIEQAIAASKEVIGLVPVEAIGRVWPD